MRSTTEEFMILDCTAPVDEPCAMVGTEGYSQQAREEGNRLIGLMQERLFENAPEGVSLKLKSNPHDLGSYYTIEAVYDSNDEEQEKFVLWLEGHTPATWDFPKENWKDGN